MTINKNFYLKYKKYKNKYRYLEKLNGGSDTKKHNKFKYIEYYLDDQMDEIKTDKNKFINLYNATIDKFINKPINLFECLSEAWINDIAEGEGDGICPHFSMAVCDIMDTCDEPEEIPQVFFVEAAFRDMIYNLILTNTDNDVFKRLLKKLYNIK